ncbi:MAG TPA: VWA domain-containing protein [Acidobacteriaceae bacterium]|nr:VWA domain-containing protein [Acidobacteriaceae bacterium]
MNALSSTFRRNLACAAASLLFALAAAAQTQTLPSAPSSSAQTQDLPSAPSSSAPAHTQAAPAPAKPAAPPATAPPAATPAAQPAAVPQAAAPAPPAAAPPTAEPAAPSDADAPVLKVQSNEVDLVFTVTDKKGHFVTGLNQDKFVLLDNGRPPEQVFHFVQQTNLPLRVGIMLDTSSSIRGRFAFEQDSAISFLLEVLHRNDRAFVEGFDVQLDIPQPFTGNIALLNQAVKKLRPGGGTALYDAIYSTCHDQMLTLRDSEPTRRAIILVSDGDDNYSHALESDAIKECQRADTTIYAISTNVSPSRDKGDDVLQAIANATGGRAFYPTRIEDVAAGFSGIEEELRSEYLLEYRPANFKQDGSFRTIYLQSNDSHYHVRAHTGYFAPHPAQ